MELLKTEINVGTPLDDILEDLKERAQTILKDNNSYEEIFDNLKQEIIGSYLRSDFRLSVLKKYCSELIAILYLVDKS